MTMSNNYNEPSGKNESRRPNDKEHHSIMRASLTLDPNDDVSSSPVPKYCFLKISIGGVVQKDPVVIALNNSTCPKTCRNFVALCTYDDAGTTTTTRSKPRPTYRGCEFHRIIDNFMVQSGDFERFDGTGGYSPLFGDTKKNKSFPDENLQGKHDQAGILSMANSGKDTNKSQFFITLQPTPHLDGKHVVFGKVVSGMNTAVFPMLLVERNGDRPVSLQKIVIQDCGVGTGTGSGSASLPSNTQKEEEAGRRRHRKHKKQRKEKKGRDSSSSSGRSDEEKYSSSSSEEERRRRRKRRKHKRRSREGSSNSLSTSDNDDDDSRRKKNRKKRHRKEHKHKKQKRHRRS